MPRSLQGRMLALSAVATLIALAIAGWAIAGVLERFVTAGIDRRLDAEVTLLAATIDRDGHVDGGLLRQRVGALESDHGWRWRITGADGTIGSADFPVLDPRSSRDAPGPPEVLLAHPSSPGEDRRLHPRDGRDEHGGRVHARALTITTARGPITITAAAPPDIVERPILGALTPLLLALAALAAVLSTAALFQLRLGLRPLRRLRDQVAAIRTGARRAVDEDQPSELRPLAIELNALNSENAQTLAAARLSAANLAHALKTPVAALALDLRDDPFRSAQVSRIDAVIRRHLVRARAQAVDRRIATPVAPAIDGLVATIVRLHRDRDLMIEADVAEGLHVAVDGRDLDEIVGNLLDNAARHAAARVAVRAGPDLRDARRSWIEVRDDGPGIPIAERERVVQPGLRLDERGDGHGFGLGIVSDLTRLYGGTMTMADRPDGWFCVRLGFPIA